jgi:hypothetical protein
MLRQTSAQRADEMGVGSGWDYFGITEPCRTKAKDWSDLRTGISIIVATGA